MANTATGKSAILALLAGFSVDVGPLFATAEDYFLSDRIHSGS